MNTPTVTEPDAMRNQLFRYAQDLQDLMEQHSVLQKRHLAVLQAQGRDGLHSDLLMSHLSESGIPYLITDREGLITHAQSEIKQLLGLDESALHGLPLLQLTPHRQRGQLNALLATLNAATYSAAIELRRFEMFDAIEIDSTRWLSVLMVPLNKLDCRETFWLLQPSKHPTDDTIETVIEFELLRDSSRGLMITDAKGIVRATNHTFSRISGYEASEVIGKNAHILSSGLHGLAFYQSFWSELLEQGSWEGEFFNRRKNGQIYPEWKTIRAVKNSAGEITCFISVFADSSNHTCAIEHLSRLAYHDALTGLPNRRLLEDRMTQALSQAQREDSGLSLLFIDLDRFKAINDLHGHEIGDLVLQEVGRRLKRSVRLGDTAARVGGDEFVILLQNTIGAKDVKAIANTLLSELRKPIHASELQFEIGASIGCARYPQDGTDIATLLKNADSAMYAAKRAIGSSFCFFDEQND